MTSKMGIFSFGVTILALFFHLARADVNVLFVLDEGNTMTETGIDGAIMFAEDKNLGKVGASQTIRLKDEEKHVTRDRVCAVIDAMIDEGTPPDIVIDYSYWRKNNEIVKELSRKLGLPTVTATMGEPDAINAWHGLSPEEEKYLIQIRSPTDMFAYVIRDLVQAVNMTNAVILYDDTFVMTHHHKSLMYNLPFRTMIQKLDTRHDYYTREQIRHMKYKNGFTNFIILADPQILYNTLGGAVGMGFTDAMHYWIVGTKDAEGYHNKDCCSAKNMSVLHFKPQMPIDEAAVDSLNSSYGITIQPTIDIAFYVNLAAKAIAGVEKMKVDGTWPEMTYYKCEDLQDGVSNIRSLDLVSALQSSPVADMWGDMIFESNGKSRMDFTIDVHLAESAHMALPNTLDMGTWKPGVPGIMTWQPWAAGMIPKFRPREKLRVIVVEQPPFVEWNEDSQIYEGLAIDLFEEIARRLKLEYTMELAEDGRYGFPDEGTYYEYRSDSLHQWDGMIGELQRYQADIGVGAVQVATEKEFVIDFTTPWYERVGFQLMMKAFKEKTNIWKFITIMNPTVWGVLFSTFFGTAGLIYFYERISPDSYLNNLEYYKNDKEQRIFTWIECCWFAFCTMTPQGAGLVPKNASGKWVAASWWIFCFIAIASYTANLAAYLTVARLKKPILGWEDLMGSTKDIDYNIIQGSEMDRYFSKMTYIEETFYTAWKYMSADNSITEWERSKIAVWDYPIVDRFTKIQSRLAGMKWDNMSQAVAAVKASHNESYGSALFGDASEIKWQDWLHCDIKRVDIGVEYAAKPYAFPMPKGSHLKPLFDYEITKLRDEGYLEHLRWKWWEQNPKRVRGCKEDEDYTGAIPMANLLGIFIICAGFVVLAFLLSPVEKWWYKWKERQDANRVTPVPPTVGWLPNTPPLKVAEAKDGGDEKKDLKEDLKIEKF